MIYLATLVAVVATAYLWPETLPSERADTVICLGGGFEDGQLTRDSYFRARTCAEVYLGGGAPQIAFTGVLAAPAMAEIAVAQGVPRDAILIEPDSRSTLQNALFTARIVAPETRVIVVTDAFHLPRAWVAFQVMGFEHIALVASDRPRLRAKPLLREALAIWFNAGRLALWGATPWLNEAVREALLI